MSPEHLLQLRERLLGILQAKREARREREGLPRTLRERLRAIREAYDGSAAQSMGTLSYPGVGLSNLYPIEPTRDVRSQEPATILPDRSRKSPKSKLKGSSSEPKRAGRSTVNWQPKR